MNIDQRLEALTQTVELLAPMHKETEKHMARLAEKSAEFEEGMAKIADILANHDHPLDKLEGNRPQ
jgi:hypothetical protein